MKKIKEAETVKLLLEKLEPLVTSLPNLFKWMDETKARIKGSIILQCWHNEFLTGTDVDFSLDEVPSEEMISETRLTQVFRGKVTTVSPILNYTPTTLNSIYIGDQVEIVWNGRMDDDDAFSYQFVQNYWKPPSSGSLVVKYPDCVQEKRGTIEWYEEILYRVKKGQSVEYAVDKICSRIVKYQDRGYKLSW